MMICSAISQIRSMVAWRERRVLSDVLFTGSVVATTVMPGLLYDS
jgi:hypothetical protein